MNIKSNLIINVKLLDLIMVVFDSRINGSWSFVLYIWFSKIFLYLILKKIFLCMFIIYWL